MQPRWKTNATCTKGASLPADLHRVHVGFITDSFLGSDDRLFEGGAERHLFRIIELLRRLGVEVTVYQRAEISLRFNYHGILVVRHPAGSFRPSVVLARMALADGCTHIHFQNLGRLPRRLPINRTTATSHGVHWDIPYIDEFHRWYRGNRLMRFALPIWRRLQKSACLTGISRCRAVLSVGTSLLTLVQSDRPELRNRIVVVPNFSDLNPSLISFDEDQSADSPLAILLAARKEGAIIVLVPRNLSLVRGGAWLVDIVAASVGQSRSNCEFFFTGVSVDVYGRADKYLHLLEKDIKDSDSSVRERLHMLGGLDHELMAKALNLCDIVLIPTFAAEGTSLAAIEAMSFGRPVVCTNVGGLNDLVRDQFNGLLVSTTAEDIAAGVVRLANDTSLRRRLGEEARHEAAARFTLESWEKSILLFAQRAGWVERDSTE